MTILLSQATIAPLSDLSGVLILPPATESETESSGVSVRQYAGGRRRVISTPATSRMVNVAWTYMTRANFAALEALVGVPILFRDSRSRRVFGVFRSIASDELRGENRLANVSVTIEEITFDEAA
jgi:hypothetical protein